MKKILGFLILLSGSAVFAKGNITCTGNKDFQTSEALVLYINPVGEPASSLQQKMAVPYRFEAFDGQTLIEKTDVEGWIEDDAFSFRSTTGEQVTGVIFLDEPDQSAFTINGTESTFICDIQ